MRPVALRVLPVTAAEGRDRPPVDARDRALQVPGAQLVARQRKVDNRLAVVSLVAPEVL